MLGAWRQPARYSSVHDTISALAARGAADRWIMSAAFVLLGLCHVVTGLGLRRPLLVIGGVATALLAAAPQPAHGSSAAHVVLAAVALVALAVWAVLDRPRLATAALIVLLLVFVVSLRAGTAVGVTERALTVAEALWPMLLVRLVGRRRGVAADRVSGTAR